MVGREGKDGGLGVKEEDGAGGGGGVAGQGTRSEEDKSLPVFFRPISPSPFPKPPTSRKRPASKEGQANPEAAFMWRHGLPGRLPHSSLAGEGAAPREPGGRRCHLGPGPCPASPRQDRNPRKDRDQKGAEGWSQRPRERERAGKERDGRGQKGQQGGGGKNPLGQEERRQKLDGTTSVCSSSPLPWPSRLSLVWLFHLLSYPLPVPASLRASRPSVPALPSPTKGPRRPVYFDLFCLF